MTEIVFWLISIVPIPHFSHLHKCVFFWICWLWTPRAFMDTTFTIHIMCLCDWIPRELRLVSCTPWSSWLTKTTCLRKAKQNMSANCPANQINCRNTLFERCIKKLCNWFFTAIRISMPTDHMKVSDVRLEFSATLRTTPLRARFLELLNGSYLT